MSDKTEPKLTPTEVTRITRDCLYRVASPNRPAGAIEVTGVRVDFYFCPEYVEEHRAEIQAMLDELSPRYQQGASFLEACYDKTGRQWTGDQRLMDLLFCLGMAIGQVRACAPREFWSALPGGMPYYFVAQTGSPVPWLHRSN